MEDKYEQDVIFKEEDGLLVMEVRLSKKLKKEMEEQSKAVRKTVNTVEWKITLCSKIFRWKMLD